MAAVTLSLAVCLFPGVAALDFAGPVELFSFLSPEFIKENPFPLPVQPSHVIVPTYLSISKEPLRVSSGFDIKPAKSYEEVTEQFDILLVPGGLGTRPEVCPKTIEDFIRKQAPGAKYVMSICTGSQVLARAGILSGKRATTNKAAYKLIVEETKDLDITWVPKARWVVDGKVWTSSGVTAGADMAFAFLESLVGTELATVCRGIVELSVKKEGDDEFAEFHGLV